MKKNKKIILIASCLILSFVICSDKFYKVEKKLVASTNSAICNVNPSQNNGGFEESFNHINNSYYTIDCVETYEVTFDTPRINYGSLNDAIIAGTAFDYNSSASSVVECTLNTKSITVAYMDIPEIPTLTEIPAEVLKRDSSTKTCYESDTPDEPKPGDPPITGPTEEFEVCVLGCDNGLYTQDCINSCNQEVYLNDSQQLFSTNNYNVTTLDKKNNDYTISFVCSSSCDSPYCSSYTETTYGPWYVANQAEIDAATAQRALDIIARDAALVQKALAEAYNAEVDSFVAAANSKPGVSVSVSGSGSDGGALDWGGLNSLPDTLPENPSPSATTAVMTIKEDSASKYYSLSGNGAFTIPYKSVIDAVTGEVIELTDGNYPNIPYYDLTDEMKTRTNINVNGYNYFTNVYTLTSKLVVNSNGEIGTGNTQTSGIHYTDRSIEVTITGGHGGSFDVYCGYDIINYLLDDECYEDCDEIPDGGEGLGINIMYRPIDMLDVFPNRSARWNWRGDYAEIALNDSTLFNTQESIYSDSNLEYTVNMSKDFIQTLRNLGSDYYNGSAYDFKLICNNNTNISNCKSQLIEKVGSSNITRSVR